MGTVESIPLVYRGVMYVILPGAGVRALDASSGATIWEYKREGNARPKTLAIFDDLVFYTGPDSMLVALDARTGAVRWETKTAGGSTSGPIVVVGKVLTGRTCSPRRENCYVAAHDAKTGKEIWKFYTAAGDDDPGGKTWGGAPEATRVASTWGLPGGYDPVKRLVYWGIANPTPNTRSVRHGGPDPKFVKWFNPDVRRGEQRDVMVMVGEGGGMWALDRNNGQFLWATPFPYDTRNFIIANIDGKTGIAHLNTDLIFREPGQNHVLCYWNTRSYWPLAYHPGQNSLFVPYVDNCLDMTSAIPAKDGQPAVPEKRAGSRRAGVDVENFAGVAKVNMSTGEAKVIYKGRAPGNGAMLATAGDLVFWGDLDGKLHAFDAVSGGMLWETALQGTVQNSTITYAVNGKQYVAVLSGEGALSGGLINQAGIKPVRGHDAMYVFALP
jgi:alcohol dehydrogenase (cytochrome c)